MSGIARFINAANEVERIALHGGKVRNKTVDPLSPLVTLRVGDVLEVRDSLVNSVGNADQQQQTEGDKK